MIPLRETEQKLFIVILEEKTATLITKVRSSAGRDKLVRQLEHEIEVLKEDMRAVLEDQEAHVEELQSANEEIVSTNEELQSINEELETSKEEIESANEELTTINHELQIRNEQLSESQEYSDVMFATIREAVIVLDKNLRVKSANAAFYRIFNVTEHQTEEKLIYELGNRQWNIPALRQLLEEVIPQKKYFTGFEVEHTFDNIGHKIMLLNGKAVAHEGSNQRVILLAIEDITVQRESQRLLAERESWFRNTANNAPVMLWVSGTDKRKTFFNETWLEFTGKKLTEAQGYGWQNFVHAQDVREYLNIYDDHVDKQLPFSVEYRLKRADGNYRWVLDVAKPSYRPDGTFTGYIGSSSEVHDKRIIQEELEQLVNQRTYELQKSNNALQRSNNELQQFAYVASHDLQEPLRKILTFADRLQRMQAQFPPDANQFLNKIIDSSERMRKLIEELLEFSRTTRANQKLESVDLQKLLKDVLADFDLIIQEKKASVTHDTLPAIEAIPIQMEQLLHNLISNALKFAKPDVSPVITITSRIANEQLLRIHVLDRKVNYIEIVVTDNGIGFSPQYADQIFDIFQRLNYKQDYPGTGIGLALCRKIVSNHKGKIFADSTENEGAAFHVILPMTQGN